LLTADRRLPPVVCGLSGKHAILGTPSIDGGFATVFAFHSDSDVATGWREQGTLRPAKQRDQFGREVVVDGTTAVIGSSRPVETDSEESSVRRAHIHGLDGGQWRDEE
jgi:hypothetical protein